MGIGCRAGKGLPCAMAVAATYCGAYIRVLFSDSDTQSHEEACLSNREAMLTIAKGHVSKTLWTRRHFVKQLCSVCEDKVIPECSQGTGINV